MYNKKINITKNVITKSVINFITKNVITKSVNDKSNSKKLLKTIFFSKKLQPVAKSDTPHPYFCSNNYKPLK